MSIIIDDIEFNIVIEYKNNKNIYIRIDDNLNILVTCNRLVSNKKIIDLINNNKKGIIKIYNKKKKELDRNTFFYYLGKPYTVVYNKDIKNAYFIEDCLFVKDSKMLDKFYLQECFRIFKNELNKYEPNFNYLPKYTLKVRKMKTRWGVCNRGNNTVTLNSELLKKDITLIDYVIVHELSHFKEPNHSDRFWYEVSLRYPKYKEARKALNEI